MGAGRLREFRVTDQQLMGLALGIGILVLFCAIPVIIAYVRGHEDKRLIAKLSVLGVLSFALWFALVVWAATDKRDDSVVSRWIEKVKDKNLLPWIVGALVAIGLAGAAFSLLI